MATRCKLLCNSVMLYTAGPRTVTRYNGAGDQVAVTTWPRQYAFSAVYDLDTPEDQRFSQATPYAEIKLNVDNPAVEFVPGRHYYIDFDEVPTSPPLATLD